MDEAEQPKREILWEEQRGVIKLRAVRERGMVRIEATAVYHAERWVTEREINGVKFDLTSEIKTELVRKIAEAGKQLWLDVSS